VRRAPGEVLLANSPEGVLPSDMMEPDAAVWVRTG
jgi:hypothetical protein